MWLRYGAHSQGCGSGCQAPRQIAVDMCSFNAPGGSFEPKLDTGNADSQGPGLESIGLRSMLTWGGPWYYGTQWSFGMWGPTESAKKAKPWRI